jgi:hypothetical protein
MNRKKIILLILLLLGVLLVVYSEPYNNHWESTARRHTVSKLARMLHTYKERFHEDPASWAELCRRLPEYSWVEKQSLLWPRWASRYCGQCPREWNPDNAEDSRMSLYELMPTEDAGLLAVENLW